eukprot:m.23559 g.23559  ORF g.23559 m.23559 type:complete len:405 (+) comp7515_c0_seq1:410-1624(+)
METTLGASTISPLADNEDDFEFGLPALIALSVAATFLLILVIWITVACLSNSGLNESDPTKRSLQLDRLLGRKVKIRHSKPNPMRSQSFKKILGVIEESPPKKRAPKSKFYFAIKPSPPSQEEHILGLHPGDVVLYLNREQDWFWGRLRGEEGWFDPTCVIEIGGDEVKELSRLPREQVIRKAQILARTQAKPVSKETQKRISNVHNDAFQPQQSNQGLPRKHGPVSVTTSTTASIAQAQPKHQTRRVSNEKEHMSARSSSHGSEKTEQIKRPRMSQAEIPIVEKVVENIDSLSPGDVTDAINSSALERMESLGSDIDTSKQTNRPKAKPKPQPKLKTQISTAEAPPKSVKIFSERADSEASQGTAITSTTIENELDPKTIPAARASETHRDPEAEKRFYSMFL